MRSVIGGCAVLALIAGVAAASTASAQEAVSWNASCETLHSRLNEAFESAPQMAIGNRTKVDRLLRDAQVSGSQDVCVVKLQRAHALLAQAYDDAGETLEVIDDTES